MSSGIIQSHWDSKRFQDSRFSKDFNSISRLGRGGFGYVFKAHRISVAKDYAVKVIQLPTSEEEVAKFLQEASVLAQLEHANIVRYYTNWSENLGSSSGVSESEPGPSSVDPSRTDSDIVFQSGFETSCSISGTTPKSLANIGTTASESDDNSETLSNTYKNSNSYLFIEMELCDRTLRDYIDDLNKRDSTRLTRLSGLSKIASIFIQITVAVKFIHSQNIIHRDLKPNNIFMVTRGSQDLVKIGDFGMACIAAPSSNQLKAYQTQGTHYYIAPEMKSGSLYDAKVDVYSTGVILFELMYKFNTQSERADVLSNICNRQMLFPAEFSTTFSNEKDQIQKMLEHDPYDRQSSRQVHIWAKKYRDRFKGSRPT